MTAAKSTAAAAKPTLSEQQRIGAVNRAKDALAAAQRIECPTTHPHAKLVALAILDCSTRADEAKLAASVADAQYASRKAEAAQAAALWLFGQR